MSILRVVFSVGVYGQIYGSIVRYEFAGRVCDRVYSIGLRVDFFWPSLGVKFKGQVSRPEFKGQVCRASC